MAKSNSPIWVYLTVLLAAMVGLAMTPTTTAQDAGATPGASSSTPGQGSTTPDQSAQPGQQTPQPSPGMSPSQNPSSASPSSTTPNSQGAQEQGAQGSQSAISATGCLQKASSGSGYQLTDTSSMKTYDLTAASGDVDLSAHVGHTVTVTGTPAQASASSGAAGANPSQTPGANPAGEANAAPGEANAAPGAGAANPSASGQPNQPLSVTAVTMVSSSCQSGQ